MSYMRINKFIAQATGLSRRAADSAIEQGKVRVNALVPTPGQQIAEKDIVTLNGERVTLSSKLTTIMLNKPRGYVVSRDGQGSKTIYDLLPDEYHALKPVGRLDKDSTGLLLLTNDGQLAQELTHPSRQKIKMYEVSISTPLQPLHRQMIEDYGVQLTDGPSKLKLERLVDGDNKKWRVTMHEGRNRQIRRTFVSLGYNITSLHRTHFGPYALDTLQPGEITVLERQI